MSRKDQYYNRAKQQGYRTRAAFKLLQLDGEESIFSPGDTVVDLGAAPGGWLQVAAEAVGEEGRVVGVDLQRIKPLEDPGGDVLLLREDITTEGAADSIIDSLSGDCVDVVLSDMAPEMTGEYSLDQARSVHLAETAVDLATSLLGSGGHVVVKVFEGEGVDELRDRMAQDFEHVRMTRPDATRDSSSEMYLVGKRHVDSPVSVGDRLDAEIVDTGREGDGIAYVDGYTLFVPDVAVGDNVEIEVEAVKANYGFARVLSGTGGAR